MLRIICAAALAAACLLSAPAGAGDMLAGVNGELAAKARDLVAECGSTVIAGVAGRPGRSNHPRGRAVDLRGNPSCIYANLKRTNWPGGVSTDYATVTCATPRGVVRCPHVHVSYNPNGQEWGLWFKHGTRHAHRSSPPGRATAHAAIVRHRPL